MEQISPVPKNSDKPQSTQKVHASRVNTEVSTEGYRVDSYQDRVDNLVPSALNFLSEASNETLGAGVIGLFIATYLILGRVGLVLIGAAGGVILHATWEGSKKATGIASDGAKDFVAEKGELNLAVVRQGLEWESGKSTGHEDVSKSLENDDDVYNDSSSYAEFRPAIAKALNDLTDSAIRNYICHWYNALLPSETRFPEVCRQALAQLISTISSHLWKKRPVDPFLDFLAHFISVVVVFLRELSTALRAGDGLSADEAIHRYLEQETESNLAHALNEQQQEHRFRLATDEFLAKFLQSQVSGFPPSRIFLREMLVGLAFKSTIEMCSKPEWINNLIIHLLQDGKLEPPDGLDVSEENGKGLAANTCKSPSLLDQESRRARRLSRAEEAMQEAMLEARRINEMIAKEDAQQNHHLLSGREDEKAMLLNTNNGLSKPTLGNNGQHQTVDRHSESPETLQQTSVKNFPPAPGTTAATHSFTDFDQLVPTQVPTALQASHISDPTTGSCEPPVLRLLNASINILDDGVENEQAALRSKPVTEYLIQIEPSTAHFPGWMVARRYQDFERLHEVLGRISTISGVSQFANRYLSVPAWRGQSRSLLRRSLQQYLQDAARYEPLAESEAMKKFLEKETGLREIASSRRKVILQRPAALETMGKGFVNALGQAPRGIAGGSKAVLDGVQGVFGTVGSAKKSAGGLIKSAPGSTGHTTEKPESLIPRSSHETGQMSSRATHGAMEDQLEAISAAERMQTQPQSSAAGDGGKQGVAAGEHLQLPPRPSDMPHDYRQPTTHVLKESAGINVEPTEEFQTPSNSPEKTVSSKSASSTKHGDSFTKAKTKPMTEEEGRISVELMFAIITELYSLSSAWTLRLSLLGAAKTIFLRPNNPQLESIRLLLQDSVIDANFVSEEGIAAQIHKLRETILPTEAEAEKHVPTVSEADKERLRISARKLLIERGMPRALTGVMGYAASCEALGKLFDCLQVGKVARGLLFALLLQALRTVTQ